MTRTFRSIPLLLLVLLLGMQMFATVCGVRCGSAAMPHGAGDASHGIAGAASMVRCDACPHRTGARAAEATAAGPMQICSHHEEAFAAAAEQRLAAPVIDAVNLPLLPGTTVQQIQPRLHFPHMVRASISPGSRFPSLLNIRV